MPFVGALPCVQPFPDGTLGAYTVRQRGLARSGRCTIAASGAGLPDWLLSGTYTCLRITGARMSVGSPTEVPARA